MNVLKKITSIACLIVPSLVLSSCDGSNEALTSDKLKLTVPYTEESNFIDDGIGFVTLSALTDGDTATFNLNSTSSTNESSVRIRFYNIDTPESTGSVEKWGKAASKFTGDKLSSATELLLEATTSPASHDSYGERYLGYIWYKASGMTDFKNLNVEIVENGFSASTSTPNDKYYSQFKAAESYAKSKSLYIWSNDEDPLYNDDPVEVTLAELKADLATNEPNYYDIENEVGSKVRFEAYIIKHTKSGTTSVTNYYTVGARNADGTITTMELYGGYSSDTLNSYVKVGYLYSFVGSVQKHSGSYQIAIGGTYVALQTGTNLMHRVQKDYYVTFNSSNSGYKNTTSSSFYSTTTITAVTKTSTLLTITATGYKSVDAEDEADISTFTFTVALTDGSDVSKFVVGKSFTVSAYQTTATSNIFEIASLSDIVLK